MRDRGVSDIVGTMLLLGVTISLIGVFAIHTITDAAAKEPPVRLEMRATLSTNNTVVSLLHIGGAAIPQENVRVVIGVGAQTWHDAIVGPPGALWSVGRTLNVTISAPPAGTSPSVSVVHTGRGETLATATLRAAASDVPPVPATFSVTLQNLTTPTIVRPGTHLIEVVVTHSFGRKAVEVVHANASAIAGPSWVKLHDDGTHGDSLSSDGRWTVILDVPPASPTGSRTIPITARSVYGASASTTASIMVS